LLFGIDGTLRVTHHEYLELFTTAHLGIRYVTQEVSTPVEKRYPYTQNLELLSQAKSSGFDDYVLVNADGFITETAIANLVLKISGQWVTPPLSDGVLPGVVRALLIEKNGVIVRQIPAKSIDEIECGFVVSSLKIAQPIGQIEDRILAISPDTEQMRAEFAATALVTSVG
jgi:branched-chain amino acid aminotransferase